MLVRTRFPQAEPARFGCGKGTPRPRRITKGSLSTGGATLRSRSPSAQGGQRGKQGPPSSASSQMARRGGESRRPLISSAHPASRALPPVAAPILPPNSAIAARPASLRLYPRTGLFAHSGVAQGLRPCAPRIPTGVGVRRHRHAQAKGRWCTRFPATVGPAEKVAGVRWANSGKLGTCLLAVAELGCHEPYCPGLEQLVEHWQAKEGGPPWGLGGMERTHRRGYTD